MGLAEAGHDVRNVQTCPTINPSKTCWRSWSAEPRRGPFVHSDALTAVDRALRRRRCPSRRRPTKRASPISTPGGTSCRTGAGARQRVAQESSSTIRVAPHRTLSLETQKRFNAALVDHINRNAARIENRRRPSARCAPSDANCGRSSASNRCWCSTQTITVYVDSKDRSLGGSDIRQRLALTEQRLLALKRDVEQGALQRGVRHTGTSAVQWIGRQRHLRAIRGSLPRIAARDPGAWKTTCRSCKRLRRGRHRVRAWGAGAPQGARYFSAASTPTRRWSSCAARADSALSRVTGCRIFNARQTALAA